ncbi:MAG: Fe-S protein assembly co-chaperone HscB [Gammaproteobacteria bacterium]|nr:Fe-S protein assembly co-chaperone HscB [Gammaproteobacteria bacterium]
MTELSDMDISQNYFELFDIPVGFELDLSMLRRKYQELQKVTHPDRYASASEQERLLSVQKAALINDAFTTLKHPLSRAKYLLQLHGVNYDDEKNTIADGAFLMQQMELREAIASIPGTKDPYGAAAQVIEEIEKHMRGLYGFLQREFEVLIPGAPVEEMLDAIRKLQFFEKLRHEAELVESKLDD